MHKQHKKQLYLQTQKKRWGRIDYWLFFIVCGAATALLFLGYHNPDIYKNFFITDSIFL